MGFYVMYQLFCEFWVLNPDSVDVWEVLICDFFLRSSSSSSDLFYSQNEEASILGTDLFSISMSRSSLLDAVRLDSDLIFIVLSPMACVMFAIRTSFRGLYPDLLSSYLFYWDVICSQMFVRLVITSSAATMKTVTTSTTTATTITATTITATPITATQTPTQAPIQTAPDRYRPIHTISDDRRHFQTEFITCYFSLACYFSLVLVCYFRYFDKWMDHLLILTSLPCAGWLNCLVLFLTIQTLPLKFKLKTLEKWKNHLLILTRLPCAIVLLCLVLFRTSQTCPFNLTRSFCLWKLNMVVVVELSDLWRAQRDNGDSLNSVVMVVILIDSRKIHVNLVNQINV